MPAESRRQFGLALAVIAGKSTAMPMDVAREMVAKTPHEQKVKWGRALAKNRKRKDGKA